MIGVVSLIACGLFLFTYHYTEFHAFGFGLIMIASFLSGLRWTITQLITQKHELGKVKRQMFVRLRFNAQRLLPRDWNWRRSSLLEAWSDCEMADHRERRRFGHDRRHCGVERTDRRWNCERNCIELFEWCADERWTTDGEVFDATICFVVVRRDPDRDRRTDDGTCAITTTC